MRWNWYWWLVGGGIALLAYKARADTKAVVDRLVVVVTMQPGYNITEVGMADLARAIGLAGSACPGLPPLGELLELEAGRTEGEPGKQGNQTVRAVFKATYAHDRTGPLRTEVLSCLFQRVKAANGNVLAIYAARPEASA